MTDEPPKTQGLPFYRNPDYLLLVSAQGLSLTGREIESLVMPLLVLGLTGSPVQAGFIAACQSAPYFVLSLIAGALVDRFDRKWMMLTCDGVRVIAFGSIPVAWTFGALHIAQLYVVALTAGSAFVFYNIAEISALPLVAGTHELTRAASTNTVIEWIGENLGPAIGGILIGLRKSTVAGAVLAYAVQCGIMFTSLFFLGGIRKPLRARRGEGSQPPLWFEVRQGISWLFAHREIRAMAFLAAALAVVFGPVQLALIVMARQEFQARPVTIGLLFSMGGVVGILTTLTAPQFRRWFSAGPIIVYGTFVWVLGLAGMAVAGSALALGVGWSVLTGVSGIRDVVSIAYRLSLIPADMQGRVNSVFRFVAWGLRPASLAFGGLAIGAFGPRAILWTMTAGMVATAVAAAFSPLRRAR